MTPPLQPLRVSDLWPGMVAAASFAICNVLSKLVLAAGSDVLTLSLFRGLVGVALLFIWLNAVSLPSPLTPRARLILLGLGLLFAGVVFGLFAAISIATVRSQYSPISSIRCLRGLQEHYWGSTKWDGVEPSLQSLHSSALR